MTQPGIEPQSPRTLVNTLPTRPMSKPKTRLKNVVKNNLRVLSRDVEDWEQMMGSNWSSKNQILHHEMGTLVPDIF